MRWNCGRILQAGMPVGKPCTRPSTAPCSVRRTRVVHGRRSLRTMSGARSRASSPPKPHPSPSSHLLLTGSYPGYANQRFGPSVDRWRGQLEKDPHVRRRKVYQCDRLRFPGIRGRDFRHAAGRPGRYRCRSLRVIGCRNFMDKGPMGCPLGFRHHRSHASDWQFREQDPLLRLV